MAGAIPKLMMSASESSSRPNSLVVFVKRAMPPSSQSIPAARPMVFAAISKSAAARLGFVAKFMTPWMERMIERKPRKILPAVNSVGSA